MTIGRGQLRGGAITVAVCALWAFLALRRPELTYHFAPLIAATAWPVALRTGGRRSRRDAAIGGVAAAAVVIVTGLVLHVADALDGPTFWNDGPALSENIIFALVGAGFGARVASRERPGLLGSLFGLE
ncbi:MAG: hypothetical protein ACR2P0_12790 [Acidimicrobiales bacterium]